MEIEAQGVIDWRHDIFSPLNATFLQFPKATVFPYMIISRYFKNFLIIFVGEKIFSFSVFSRINFAQGFGVEENYSLFLVH